MYWPLAHFCKLQTRRNVCPRERQGEKQEQSCQGKILKLCDCFSILNITTVYLKRLYLITMSTLVKAAYAMISYIFLYFSEYTIPYSWNCIQKNTVFCKPFHQSVAIINHWSKIKLISSLYCTVFPSILVTLKHFRISEYTYVLWVLLLLLAH